MLIDRASAMASLLRQAPWMRDMRRRILGTRKASGTISMMISKEGSREEDLPLVWCEA